MAVRHRSDRITSQVANVILETIPNRIQYLDAQSFDLHPIQ